jgi:hypothetical protein
MSRANCGRVVSVAAGRIGLTAILLLVTATAAFAVVPKAAGLYKGTEPGCAPEAGYTCVFLFRVSPNGRSMTFVAKHNVIGAWVCKGGGGEAILGPYKKPEEGQPVPSLTIGTNGTFAGKQTFGSGQAKGSVVATGRFTGTGTAATIEFTVNPGPHSCTNGPIKLTLG